MFPETRYALNGDLHVAYRASREGTRDIVFVPTWCTNCEIFPEIPTMQGWVDAMTSLGRLIFLDQPGTGASDPVMPGALPTLEQWADSITAVPARCATSRSGQDSSSKTAALTSSRAYSAGVFEFCSGLVDLVVGVRRHGGGGHRLALAGELWTRPCLADSGRALL